MSWLIALLGLLIGYLGYFVSVLVFLDWSPKIRLRILPSWINKSQRQFVLRLEIENSSRVPLIKRKCELQILEHSMSKQLRLSEFVPMKKERYDKCLPNEKPREWLEPQQVFETTRFLYPGELIHVERLENIPDEDTYLHVALQFEAHIPLPSRLGLRFWGILRLKPDSKTESWTTTAVIYPPSEKKG